MSRKPTPKTTTPSHQEGTDYDFSKNAPRTGQATTGKKSVSGALNLNEILSKDEQKRIDAARKLSKQGPAATAEMRRVFKEAKDVNVRAAVIDGLGEAEDWDAVPELIDALEDEDATIRGRANAALRKIFKANFFFKANDPPEKRAKIVAYIRKLYHFARTAGAEKYRRP